MPPAVPPPVISLITPPDSAVMIWAMPTNFDVIRCLAWEEDENNCWIAVLLGKETLKIERVPDLETVWPVADLLWRCLAPSSDSLTMGGVPPGARRRRARRQRQELARSGNTG